LNDININDMAIKELVNSKPSGTKIYLWDRVVKGFGVYRTSKGVPTFVYRYRSGQEYRYKKIGTRVVMTCVQARDIARGYAYQRSQGIDPVMREREAIAEAKAADALLVRNYAEGFIDRKERSKAPFTEGNKSTIRNQIVGKLGDKRMDRITLEEVEEAGLLIQKETGASGRWFYTYVKAMFYDAEKRNAIVKSPLRALEVPQPNERDRVLSETELRIFLMAAHDMYDARGDQYEMLLRVPKRRSEVSDLPWSEIDRSNKVWIWNLPKARSKNKVAQTIHLPAQVRALLERQQPDAALRTGLVFARGGSIRPAIAHSARKVLNANMHRRIEFAVEDGFEVTVIDHFTIHDLRTAVSTALQRKPFSIMPHVIEAMLNHKPPSKVQRTYQQDRYVPEVADALRAWNDHVDALMGASAHWPGGTFLERMVGKEVERRHQAFTAGWKSDDEGEDRTDGN